MRAGPGILAWVAGPKTKRRSKQAERDRAAEVVERLGQEYPGSARQLCALRHANPFQLLVATILSAQCTDAKVNEVTPALFAAYPEPEDLAGANPEALEALIRPTGFYRNKAKSLLNMSAALVQEFSGQVPEDLDDLVTLPGVGRKTGNVVRSVAFELPGLPVDTHVGRIGRRLGFVDTDDPVKAEHELGALVPEAQWGALSLRLILHGRAVCTARKPHCDRCVVNDLCPSSSVGLATPSRGPLKARSTKKGTNKAATTARGAVKQRPVGPAPLDQRRSAPKAGATKTTKKSNGAARTTKRATRTTKAARTTKPAAH